MKFIDSICILWHQVGIMKVFLPQKFEALQYPDQSHTDQDSNWTGQFCMTLIFAVVLDLSAAIVISISITDLKWSIDTVLINMDCVNSRTQFLIFPSTCTVV